LRFLIVDPKTKFSHVQENGPYQFFVEVEKKHQKGGMLRINFPSQFLGLLFSLLPKTADIKLYILLVSEILDHDAQAANMMINQVLQTIRTHPSLEWNHVKTLWLASDCGPHFRSYENAAHFLHTLPTALNLQVHVLFLGEQHGKGACDRLFGWTNSWLMDYIEEHPVHGLSDCQSLAKRR
jgi:hypothetical protein